MCAYIPDLSGNVLAALDDMKTQVKAMSNENIPFWTSVLSWVKGDWWKTIFYHCYSCLDRSALWTLNFTMYYELCNLLLMSSSQIGGQRVRVQYIPMNDAHNMS